MRHGVVHPTDAAVFGHPEVPQQADYRLAVFLAKGMRLADVQEQVIVLVAVRVVNDGVRRGEDALPLHGTHARPISRVVEELARRRQSPQLLRAKIALQPIEHQRAHSPYVHPRAQHRYRANVAKLRHRLSYLEFANSHITILTEYVVFFKCN